MIAVNGIDISIKRGEIFGLLGPDGAGKSTTIRLLCGLLLPTAGSATVLGFDTVKQKELINPGIGYVSEGVPLYETMTVRENMEFFIRLRQIPRAEAVTRQKELLQFTRLEQYTERNVGNLSGGMKKKLALCCALIHNPEVLFLDEPTTGVDPVSRRDFWEILVQFVNRGVTICISTPYIDEAEKCHRLALIHDGVIIGLGAPDELKSQIPGESLELGVAEPWKALEALSGLPGIVRSQVLGKSVHLVVDRASIRLKDIEASLSQNNIKLEECRQIPFSMEDVFIASAESSFPSTYTREPSTLDSNVLLELLVIVKVSMYSSGSEPVSQLRLKFICASR